MSQHFEYFVEGVRPRPKRTTKPCFRALQRDYFSNECSEACTYSAPSHLTYLIDRVDISVAQMVPVVPDPEPQKPGQRFVVE